MSKTKQNAVLLSKLVNEIKLNTKNYKLLGENISTLKNTLMIKGLSECNLEDANHIVYLAAITATNNHQKFYYYRVGEKGNSTTYTLYVGEEQERPRFSRYLEGVEIVSYGSEFKVYSIRGRFITDLLEYVEVVNYGYI